MIHGSDFVHSKFQFYLFQVDIRGLFPFHVPFSSTFTFAIFPVHHFSYAAILQHFLLPFHLSFLTSFFQFHAFTTFNPISISPNHVFLSFNSLALFHDSVIHLNERKPLEQGVVKRHVLVPSRLKSMTLCPRSVQQISTDICKILTGSPTQRTITPGLQRKPIHSALPEVNRDFNHFKSEACWETHLTTPPLPSWKESQYRPWNAGKKVVIGAVRVSADSGKMFDVVTTATQVCRLPFLVWRGSSLIISSTTQDQNLP